MTAPTYDTDLCIPARFCGPARSGNGGYTSGLLAARVLAPEDHPGERPEERPAVEVTLRQPPPLDVSMQVRQLPPGDPANRADVPVTTLFMGGARIAEARTVADDLEPVEAVGMAQATDAMAGFPGLVSHPFPTCFACGVDRAEGDGLRIFPGPVAADRVASLWVPHPSLAESGPEPGGLAPGGLQYGDLLEPGDPLDQHERRVGVGTAWAALDCVGGWAGDLGERKMVLGRITAHVDALPVVGEPHVVVGQARGADGRKTFTASTLYDSDGRIVARARHVWIAVDPDNFR